MSVASREAPSQSMFPLLISIGRLASRRPSASGRDRARVIDVPLDPISGDLARRGVDAVERIDGSDRYDQAGQLRLIVVAGRLFPNFIRDRLRSVCEAGGGLSQGQSRSLGVVE